MPDYRRRPAREAMSVRVDLSGVVAREREEFRLERQELEPVIRQVAGLTEHWQKSRKAGELPPFDLAEVRRRLGEIKEQADELRNRLATLVVVGCGGTALAVQAVLRAFPEAAIPVHFLDHVDPFALGEFLARLDLQRTAFQIISKSGETPETVAQFLLLRDLLLRQLGGVEYSERLILATDADQGALRQIVHDEGFRSLVIPAGVAERFAVLSPAALFPASLIGVRIDELIAGAAWMEERCTAEDPWQNPAALLAAAAFVLERQHRVQGLLCVPFSCRLESFAAWAGALWVEGLRRAHTAGGAPAIVPWLSLARPGADLAWAAQLAAGGAGGVLSVLLTVEDHGRELPLAAAYSDLDAVAYLGGKTLGEVVEARTRALEVLLARHGRPFVRLQVPQINPFTVGQLLYLWELVVWYLATLYGLDPFRAPAMEEYRRLLLAALGRKGLEDEAEEVEATLRQQPQWVV